MPEFTQERLKELLDYNPETGMFQWCVPRRGVRVGDVAGTERPDGYRQITVDGKMYRAHRLAWLYVHGCWPVFQIDHINGVRDDNRSENLREAKSAGDQRQNQAIRSNNTSGHQGVSWNKRDEKWRAGIQVDGKNRYLGYFDNIEDAARAYRHAKRKYHKFSPEIRAAA